MGITIAFVIHSVDPIQSLEGFSMGVLSGIAIAFVNHSVDPTTFSKAINGVNGAHDSKQNPGVVYSEVVEIRADFFDKL